MKLRSAQLDEIYNEFTYVFSQRADLESRITLALARLFYRLKIAFMLGALSREARRRRR